MEHQDVVERTPRRVGRTAGLVATGLVAGLALAGLGMANAQQTSPPTRTPGQAPSEAPPEPGERPRGPKPGRGGHGIGKLGDGALHGEFTTRAPGGGYQVLATQVGEVTAVGPTSIAVRSEDGYARTYVVTDDTLVNAGDEGIADVAVGDTVHVLAVVADGQARAVRVDDRTQVRRLRERWQPRRPEPAPTRTS